MALIIKFSSCFVQKESLTRESAHKKISTHVEIYRQLLYKSPPHRSQVNRWLLNRQFSWLQIIARSSLPKAFAPVTSIELAPCYSGGTALAFTSFPIKSLRTPVSIAVLYSYYFIIRDYPIIFCMLCQSAKPLYTFLSFNLHIQPPEFEKHWKNPLKIM